MRRREWERIEADRARREELMRSMEHRIMMLQNQLLSPQAAMELVGIEPTGEFVKPSLLERLIAAFRWTW